MPPLESQSSDPRIGSADLSANSYLSSLARPYFLVLATVALIYAFLSGLRTVSDPDLFWQLATGRWVAEHHHVFSVDVFSYTAAGEPWIYPVGSGLLLYAVYLLGGYVLLSCLGAVASCGTVALLLRRGSVTSAGIAIIAVPLIAARTAPRAEMFTVILFAAFFSLLWENYRTGHARLWLLPLLMALWVNLHLGFVAGIAALLAFAGIELLEMVFPGTRRQEARERLRRSWPWFVGAAISTLLNPWGWRIYQAVFRQNRAMAEHSAWISEWGSVPLSWAALSRAFSSREIPAFYLLLAIVVIAVSLALLERQHGAALLLLGATYAGVRHIRMEALTACVVVVVGGAVLQPAISRMGSRIRQSRLRFAVATAAAALLIALAVVRSVALVRINESSLSTFGVGLSWWFPERATEFIARENIPGEMFNSYIDGGYLIWRLGPQHRVFIDGRAIPFGPQAFLHQTELLQSSPDSALWQAEAERYNINTIILPLNRFEAVLGQLRTYCNSANWRPVYLDQISVVMVRRKPETEQLIQRSQIDCATAPLPVGSAGISDADRYNDWADSASVLAALGRNSEALVAAHQVHLILPESSFVPWLRGNILYTMGLYPKAEQEYLAAIKADPGAPRGWFALANLYKHQGRIAETIQAQRQAIELSTLPQPLELVKLAQLYLDTQQPRAALEAFDEAVDRAPPDVLAATGPHSLKFQADHGRALAWRSLGDTKRATAYDEQSVQDLLPGN